MIRTLILLGMVAISMSIGTTPQVNAEGEPPPEQIWQPLADTILMQGHDPMTQAELMAEVDALNFYEEFGTLEELCNQVDSFAHVLVNNWGAGTVSTSAVDSITASFNTCGVVSRSTAAANPGKKNKICEGMYCTKKWNRARCWEWSSHWGRACGSANKITPEPPTPD